MQKGQLWALVFMLMRPSHPGSQRAFLEHLIPDSLEMQLLLLLLPPRLRPHPPTFSPSFIFQNMGSCLGHCPRKLGRGKNSEDSCLCLGTRVLLLCRSGQRKGGMVRAQEGWVKGAAEMTMPAWAGLSISSVNWGATGLV